MKHCEMCGAGIPQGENVCGNCGGTASDEDSGTDRIIGNPDWGSIRIHLASFQGDAADLLAKIRIRWQELEMRTAQRLFSGQLESLVLPIKSLELYGPRESYARLLEELTAAGADPSIIEFQSMAYDEIYKLRDGEGT